jgi:hypothetical protein
MRMPIKIVTGNSENVTPYQTKNANFSGTTRGANGADQGITPGDGQRVGGAAGSATRQRYEIVINSGPDTLRC